MRATIRVATPEDADAILTIYAPIVRETAISFEVEPPTLAEMHERIANQFDHGAINFRVLSPDHEVCFFV